MNFAIAASLDFPGKLLALVSTVWLGSRLPYSLHIPLPHRGSLLPAGAHPARTPQHRGQGNSQLMLGLTLVWTVLRC